MIKRAFISILVLILSCSSLSMACIQTSDTQDTIVKVSDAFFKGTIGMEEIADYLNMLLDTAVSLSKTSQYHDKIEYNVGVAQDLLKNDSIFNDKARQYLSFAYRMLTGGIKYERPPELDVFITPEEAGEKGIAYSKKLIENALYCLKEKKDIEAAKHLIEFVLMTVTPVSG
jgi:hypothetical protein